MYCVKSRLYLSNVLVSTHHHVISFFFFFNDTATTEIYTLSLHDALPISGAQGSVFREHRRQGQADEGQAAAVADHDRSEEHTSELQSRLHLVCRLLLEKKKNKQHTHI